VTRPAYLSPEELADVSSLSPRADVFSLATLTYELFTGRPAFVGGGDVVLDTVRMARFPRLREHRPDIHARAEHILREAWALTPDDRPPSAGRFAALFAEAVNQQAHTLVNVPTVSAAKEPPPTKATLSGPGPLDVATRKALQEGRATPISPASEATPPTNASPARGTPASTRAPRSGRPAALAASPAQRPRSFLPKPGETPDDATRPEISVPSEVRVEAQATSDETPVDGTSTPTPRFSRTTPGVPSPLPSAPTPIATVAPSRVEPSPPRARRDGARLRRPAAAHPDPRGPVTARCTRARARARAVTLTLTRTLTRTVTRARAVTLTRTRAELRAGDAARREPRPCDAARAATGTADGFALRAAAGSTAAAPQLPARGGRPLAS
jgi:hypothetical protein